MRKVHYYINSIIGRQAIRYLGQDGAIKKNNGRKSFIWAQITTNTTLMNYTINAMCERITRNLNAVKKKNYF